MLITDEQLKSLLVSTKITDLQTLATVEEFAKGSDSSLAEALLEKDIISDENLGILISDHLKIPFVVLAKLTIPENVFSVIPEKFARKYKVVPFARDQQGVKVAMADPTQKQTTEMFCPSSADGAATVILPCASRETV